MAHDPSVFAQPRFRLGLVIPTDQNSAYDASDPAENANATIGTGNIFTFRAKVDETASGTDSGVNFKVQCNINSGSYGDVGTDAPGGGAAQPVSSVLISSWADGATTTTERLTSEGTYVTGEADEQSGVTGAGYALSNQATEFIFALRINSWYDNAGVATQIVAGDTINLRLVESDGTAFAGTYVVPTITVAETDYYIGGTFAETIETAMQVDGNGNIYYWTEVYDTGNGTEAKLLKSTNGGKTWREANATSAPTSTDQEGVSMRINPADTDILCVLTDTTGTLYYHEYRMSTHPTNPDTWAVADEVVDNTYTSHTTNECSLEIRDAGGGNYKAYAFYVDDQAPALVRYKIRSTGGTWGSINTVDTAGTDPYISPITAKDSADVIHIVYKQEASPTGTIWHNTLSTGDALGTRQSIATGIGTGSNRDNMPYTNLTHYLDGSVEVIPILYQTDTDTVITSVYLRDGTPQTGSTATDAVASSSGGGSHQLVACAAVYGKEVLLIYANDTNSNWYLARNDDEAGWGTDTLEASVTIDSDQVTSLVLTHSSGNGGNTVLAFIHDDGSDGGHGHQWYDEVILATPAAGPPPPFVLHQKINTLLRM